jgi:methyltransferase-like protein
MTLAVIEPYGRGKDFNHDLLRQHLADGYRVCTKCGDQKSLEFFSRRKTHVTGYKGQCKECDKKDFSKWKNANAEYTKEVYRRSHYTKKYGLSAEESVRLSNPENRKGNCPICGIFSSLVMDHNHDTGKVRDLICGHCNSLLGYAKESKANLLAAIDYLDKHGSLK